MWTGLMLGTALAVLAMMDGVRLKVGGIPPFLGWILGGLIVWLLVIFATAAVAEVLRRHHRAIGRYAGRQAGRGARHGLGLARRHGGRGLSAAGQWADNRWQARQSGPQPASVREPVELGGALRPSRWRRQVAGSQPAPGQGPFTDPDPTPADGLPAVPAAPQPAATGTAADAPSASPATSGDGWGAPDPGAGLAPGPWMLAIRRKDGRPYYDGPGGSQLGTAVVRDPDDLRRRLAAAAADPDAEVRVAPVKVTDPDLAPGLSPAAEADIKRQVCHEAAADDIVPEEVIVGTDGSIKIDRRLNPTGRHQQAVPLTGELRWSPFRGAPRVYAAHPSRAPAPGADPVPADVEQAIRERVSEDLAAEGVQPGDVTVGPYGLITVDRSCAHPGQTAWDGIRWVPLPNGQVAVTNTWPIASSAGGTVPPAANENQNHGGTGMTTGTTTYYPPGYAGPPPAASGAGLPRRTARTAAAPEPNGVWKSVISSTHGFEPESDSHLLGWMAGEAGGMSGYAEEIADVYETAVNTIGLDPVAMAALHDYADAAATAAEEMAKARQRFADHYSEVREFTANGGVLPYNGRWMTGEGD
jgi:hypothetical protein